MENLKKGDLVVLKSNGPLMTVKHKMADGTWLCSWFDSKNELQEGYFSEEQLNIQTDK
ncbi:DUF2158 domain-containing protein [Chryseobacterium indologenes]|uniref:DUF2158 domain-containing protein n=1 Tax=Chryseobacterium indologenes TaxID=253 RepID=UPI003D32D255